QDRAVAGPITHRDHARRHELEVAEETLDFLPGVDVDPRGRVRRGEVLPLRRVAGTDGDDQVAAGGDRPGEGGRDVAGGSGVGEVQHAGQDHAGRLGQVDQLGQPGIGDDGPGVAHVAGY